MEPISNILRPMAAQAAQKAENNAYKPSQQQCRTSLAVSRPRDMNSIMVAQFGEFPQFSQRFGIDFADRISHHVEWCYGLEYPTLANMSAVYGEQKAAIWLCPFIRRFGELSGCQVKADEWQVIECAKNIASEYHFLKISEVALFFRRLSSGRYGKIYYGTEDMLALMEALQKFLRERTAEVRRVDSLVEQARQRHFQEEEKKVTSWEELLELRRRFESWKPTAKDLTF